MKLISMPPPSRDRVRRRHSGLGAGLDGQRRAVAASSGNAAVSQAKPSRSRSPGSVKPSSKARKAIVDAADGGATRKDIANIPAKLAAAQAVATTKEDHYLIGELQLKAAMARE